MPLGSVDVTRSIQEGLNEVVAFIPEFIAALAILVIGYFVAKIVGGLVARVLRRAGFDRTLHAGPGGDWVRRVTPAPARLVGRLVFWVLFLVAGALATGVSRLARQTMGGTPLGKIVAAAAPILVMAIAGFMILDQLQIAPDIVRITYAAILGAIALGSALAFGLGGRDVARQMLEGA